MTVRSALHPFGARAARRATVITTALVTAAALGTATPLAAGATTPAPQAQVSAWVSDGWGGGTVTSQPAGINCHQAAADPWNGVGQEAPTGTCYASFPVGTRVTFTATADPGSNVNSGPDPASLTVQPGYNPVWTMFCPNDDLCSAG
ncbi:hypothetical protein [Streptomyces sp. NRRL B-24484]|uniref:hypothetical protein n=1 Tax=Streptomyces sp. NRRL B-24484 TaxID=1463833 RepID=UPI000693EF2D|nr:hypothetical protein [Streptomyces sp. NRRL B-24484]